MRTTLVSILTTFSLTVTLAQAPSTVSTSVVAGQVSERISQGPVAGARVVLIRDVAQQQPMVESLSTVTDKSGRYFFDGLAPGEYRVDVRKDGYALLLGTAPLVTLAAGEQRTSVNVMLHKGAVIYGRVIAEDGKPIRHVDVLALRRVSPNVPPVRRGSLMPVGVGDETNDLGEFRLSGLPPGEYYVQARSQLTVTEPHAGAIKTAILATYFPSTLEGVNAVPITVAEGETAAPLEIRVITVPAFDVSGVVVDEAGQPVANARVLLSLDETTQPRGPMMGGRHGTQSNGAGEFAVSGVTSGNYILMATAPVVIAVSPGRRADDGRIETSGAFSTSTSGRGVTTETRDGITVEWRDANGSEIPVAISHAHLTDLVIVVRTPVR